MVIIKLFIYIFKYLDMFRNERLRTNVAVIVKKSNKAI